MKPELLKYLVCPDCQQELRLSSDSGQGGEIEEGRLTCPSCSEVYRITRGIPRFVSSDAYVGNFSFQWNVHRRTQVDSLSGHCESAKTFRTKTGLEAADLKGRLVLDVGCGTGRFMEVAADLGAEVIGIDLSFAVDAAYANMGRRDRIHIVQADIFKLPFRPETFDVAYSIGVLHHTPNTKQAFLAVPRLVKPRGLVAIWVYVDAGEYSRRLDRIRSLVGWLPKRLLYWLLWGLVPLLQAVNVLGRLPLLRRVIGYIPVSNQGFGLSWDVMDTFDAYAPRYQWKHTEPEVLGWFGELGFEEVKSLSFPVSVRGRKGRA